MNRTAIERERYRTSADWLRRVRRHYCGVVLLAMQRARSDRRREELLDHACHKLVDRKAYVGDPDSRAIRFAVLKKIALCDGADTCERWHAWRGFNDWHLTYAKGKQSIQSRRHEKKLRAAG